MIIAFYFKGLYVKVGWELTGRDPGVSDARCGARGYDILDAGWKRTLGH